ncbi:small subunit processome component 20 homolog [Monomorium pharaonis]|uniref:small subunit processome component 20 homolog n=1 Tax=Monomorium pharaonis TaxID=307658 RepID=UPI00063EF437|nr:small subunit processome component 20 homolog [Monomorium pharaonis]
MKNKPNRHKETNVFRFKPFFERLTEIDVDVFHRVAHRNEDDAEEVETYFHETLQKWNFLNLTEGYTAFRRQVQDIVTLPQLLHRKQHVIDTLMLYLRKQDPLFLQPILELVVAVARDLQKEFYDYFPEFLSEIICLLQTKDVEQIEYLFTTLAYLFKFLWRYLTRNISTVIPLLLPLLADTQPVYINRFAAESFAFVGRKIKDKDAFLKLVLRILKDRNKNTKENGVPGFGKLLFEIVSGTPGQFHSCSEQMLLLYFNALQDESNDQELMYDLLREIVTCILQNIHSQKCNIMWNIILKVIDAFIEKSKQSLESYEKKHALILFLRLIHIIISYKNGRFLTDAVSLTRRFIIMMDTWNEDNDTLQEIINVSVAVLLASNIKLMQENSSQLLLKIMTVNDIDLLYSAVENLISYSSFEVLVLPHVLRRSISIGFDDKALVLLAKIILAKASPCLSGITLDKWRKYILDIRNIGPKNIDYLLSELKTLSIDTVSLNALRILIILPHLKPLRDEFKNTLKDGLLFLYKKILECNAEDTVDVNKTAFMFLLTLESLIHVSEPSDLHELLVKSDIRIVDLVEKHHDNKYILNAIDLCLTYFAASQHHTDYINSASFDKLNDNIVKKFSSPYGNVRLIVAHLYSSFSDVKDLKRLSMEIGDGKNAMELVYLAESEPATIQNYRSKLLHLQALGFQSHAVATLDPKYYEFPLRCLIGNLYVNFSLLWQPVTVVIASYGSKECPQFWPMFLAELTSNDMSETERKSSFDCQVVSSLEILVERHDDKPDFENHKILLWKCMTHFSHYAEMKNRDLTGLFIDFVNANFFRSNSDEGKYCSVKKRKELIDANNDTDNENENEYDEEERDGSNVKAVQADAIKRNYKVKLLLAQMEIFDKVQNPRMMHREAEMHQIYLDLISSRNADIQRAALNCLFAYKFKYLLPYKESLYNLIDEKNLKNELARFKLDRESNMIEEEHRENLMPIIMRIIYAKMITKTGMRTGGKGGGLVRRKIILRFLGGAQEDEMIVFVKMAFRPFKSYVSLEVDEAFDLNKYAKNIVDIVDLSNVMPPKRMQSAVNLLAIIIEQFGGKMSTKLLPRLLRILICILAEVDGILRRSGEVYPGYLTMIKNVRTSCVGILARFFTHFENYDWKRHEIDAVYHVAIFPSLQKLPIEGIHSPTALLKLFMAWSQNSRYYPLFAKYQEDNVLITPLPYIMQLLSNPRTHQSVINAILGMIEKMLTLQDYGRSNENAMQVDAPFLPLTPILSNVFEMEEKILSSGINYGSAILLPHVPRVLEFIKDRLKRSNKNINKTELIILSRISEFVTDDETCDMVLKLIIPVLLKKATCGGNEETVIELLTTVTNLIKIVSKPEIHLRSVAPLIGFVSDVPARKTLLRLYRIIAERSAKEHREAMIQDCDLLAMLNAWDHRWVDQPDFQKRLDAFNLINDMTERNAITLEFGATVIHNCFYFLKTESDLAMRDCSGQCLKLVGAKLAREHQSNILNRRYLMDDTILTLTRKGITSKNEAVRLQSIAFLGYMALECADVHPVLRDLSLLTNRADPEVDFFENMQHLQLYRRARALLKFCTLAKTLQKPFNPKTLTQFILPLCSSYLCNEAFIHKNSLIDAAIETVGVVCRLLPWHHYEIILKHYLGKLRSSTEFQKQVVRIVVMILDSFHYDLSKYKPAEKTIAQTETTLTETENKAAFVTEKEEANDAIGDDENLKITKQEDEEKLEEALNDENIENVEEIIEKEDREVMKEELSIMERQTLLSQYGAKKVIFSISNDLLPQLHRSIVARTRQESSHKINKKKIASETEEDDLLRVPIALALVKLLQKMPENLLDANLPGIFMKLCTFLKSRMESVRRATRETLQKIMITLGPKYLHHLLKELNTLLTKGFQVHVLAYTVQAVLVALKPYFQKFDINNNLQSILSVCKVDLFGLTAEEKEVAGIVKNVSEAKSTKSFDIFHILAEFITDSCLLDLILPLKEILMKTHSHKTIHKIVECFRNITLGLADNAYIPLEQMLIFLFGIISESIPGLMPEKESKTLAEEERRGETKASIRQSNYFLIPSEPKNRMGIKATAKTTKHANVHVIIEFGLKLYHIFLKRDKVSGTEYKHYLEPFTSVLSDCLKSQHVKLCTVTLQCLNWMLKMDLDSMHSSISDICSSMFNILHKYAAAGLSKGDNFDLVMATFKCMSVIVRDVKYFSIDADQLKILILYAEQDLHDSDKYATAFTLLKAIIHRKMIIPEMYTVMEKVAMLSITSELEHVKLQSRSVFYSYLMGYPLGKHLDKHIYFYLTQLSYEMQPGRLSALEMIHTIVTGFPLKTLTRRAEIIFLMTGARLINDDDPTCRKLCAKCIKEMLTRISFNDRNKLFDKWLPEWLNDSKIRYRTLAAQLCGIFVTVEKNDFDLRLPQILPLLLKQFHAKFSDSDNAKSEKSIKLDNVKFSEKDSKKERTKDHHLIQVLQLVLKIAHHTSILTNEKYKDSVDSFAEYSQSLLAHPHLWVRLAAAQLIGFILAALDVDKIVELLNNPESDLVYAGYMYSRPVHTLKSLILDLVAQLYPDMTFEQLADQVVKNLIFIAKILKSVTGPAKNDDQDDENKAKDNNNLSFPWLIRRLRKAVNIEITQAPKSTSVRTAMFKFIAGVVTTVPMEYLNVILFNIMSPLVREMSTTEETNAELRQLAKEVAAMIKKSIGNEDYVKLLNRVQQKLNVKKAERKKARAQQFVTDPDLAAKRKLAKQQKKKEAKKRKLDTIKGSKGAKKRKKKTELDDL